MFKREGELLAGRSAEQNFPDRTVGLLHRAMSYRKLVFELPVVTGRIAAPKPCIESGNYGISAANESGCSVVPGFPSRSVAHAGIITRVSPFVRPTCCH